MAFTNRSPSVSRESILYPRHCCIEEFTERTRQDQRRPQTRPAVFRRRRALNRIMGGDGGTLNNSRREHVRLRNRVLGVSAGNAGAASVQRASVTECALSKARLSPPHVVVDRAGNIYNKESLIAYVLARRSREKGDDPDPFAHIQSMKRDTAPVRFLKGEKQLMCSVTRKVAFVEGRFTIGWKCGCVTAPVHGVVGVGGTDENGDEKCIACDKKGSRVRIGTTLADRQKVVEKLRKTEKARKGKKKRKADDVEQASIAMNGGKRIAEALEDELRLRKVPRTASDAV